MKPQQPTILIADDDTALLEALSCRLEHEGYRVFTTQDGYQALAIARREHPDVLILDISMPAGSGFSVRERIMAIDELSEVPVIFMTGHDLDSIQPTAFKLGATTVLQKPFETGTLGLAIQTALQNAA